MTRWRCPPESWRGVPAGEVEGQAHAGQCRGGLLAALPGRHPEVRQRLGNRVNGPLQRIERIRAELQDELHPAAQLPAGRRAQRPRIDPGPPHPTGRGAQDEGGQPQQGRLAAPALAEDPERASHLDGEVHPVQGASTIATSIPTARSCCWSTSGSGRCTSGVGKPLTNVRRNGVPAFS